MAYYEEGPPMAKRFHFTYLFCTDLEAMKNFYQNILHLKLIWEDTQSLAFKIGKHQLSITFHEKYSPLEQTFSIQPGWDGGTLPAISWSLECDKKDFLDIVQTIQQHSTIKTWSAKPVWVGYWSFPVLDPMNHTIEITCTEKDLRI